MLIFQDMHFCIEVWGYNMLHICPLRYSYPLTIFFFNFIYTLKTMCDSSLGYERTTQSHFLFYHVILKHAVEL
jgi:hypothetical protein